MTRLPGWVKATTAAAVMLAVSCAGPQSVLHPAGLQANRVAALWWLMLALSVIAWIGITGALALAILRRRAPDEEAHHHARSRRRSRTIAAAVAVLVVMLGIILTQTLLVERATARATEGDALVIEVVGHQWWWDVYYRDHVPARQIRTSNEIHLPIGRTVELRVRSADVIHSLWIPNLHGKIDLLPGRSNTLRLRAEQTGVFRAQCAEFCGVQHAKMALVVVVHEAADFARWADRERAPGHVAADSLTQAGRNVFLSSSCVLCHRIRGTRANATAGPDLTHLASRRTLAAGSLPNVRGNLAGWILDPQHIKPGSLMPATQFPSEELHALLHYLESLR